MRKLLPFFLLVLLAAGLAGWQLSVTRVFSTIQPITVVLSIMAAAIFVRLNRGLPSIDWKALSSSERTNLTDRMVSIARDYLFGLFASSCSIATLICLAALSQQQATCLPGWVQSLIAAWFVFIIGISIVWMGYVVWRDYDIVLLQKQVLDNMSAREEQEKILQQAKDKSAAMKAASVVVAPTPVRPFQNNS
jgi:hypothetical protein